MSNQKICCECSNTNKKKEIIKSPCNCDSYIHKTCLNYMVYDNDGKCTTCDTPYMIPNNTNRLIHYIKKYAQINIHFIMILILIPFGLVGILRINGPCWLPVDLLTCGCITIDFVGRMAFVKRILMGYTVNELKVIKKMTIATGCNGNSLNYFNNSTKHTPGTSMSLFGVFMFNILMSIFSSIGIGDKNMWFWARYNLVWISGVGIWAVFTLLKYWVNRLSIGINIMDMTQDINSSSA